MTPVQDCVGDGLSLFALAVDEAPVLRGFEFIRAQGPSLTCTHTPTLHNLVLGVPAHPVRDI